eukprot:3434455-Lingulodinium_polyedra.AAC.1
MAAPGNGNLRRVLVVETGNDTVLADARQTAALHGTMLGCDTAGWDKPRGPSRPMPTPRPTTNAAWMGATTWVTLAPTRTMAKRNCARYGTTATRRTAALAGPQ